METQKIMHNFLDCISGKISRNDAMVIQEVTDISNLNIEIPEEKSGIEMLEELAEKYCQSCGSEFYHKDGEGYYAGEVIRSKNNSDYCTECEPNERARSDYYQNLLK